MATHTSEHTSGSRAIFILTTNDLKTTISSFCSDIGECFLQASEARRSLIHALTRPCTRMPTLKLDKMSYYDSSYYADARFESFAFSYTCRD